MRKNLHVRILKKEPKEQHLSLAQYKNRNFDEF